MTLPGEGSYAKRWGEAPRQTIQIFLYKGVPVSWGEAPQPNILDSLDKGAPAQVWLLPVGMGRYGRRESRELGSCSVRGVAGAASGLLSSWRLQAAVP